MKLKNLQIGGFFVLNPYLCTSDEKYIFMNNKEWLEKFTKNWVDVIDCQIDFSKYEPTSVGNSLHIYREEYSIDGLIYRVLTPIGSDTPLIQKLEE
jgi:hypothetical protein